MTQRAGFIIDERGTNAGLGGFWPDSFREKYGPNSWIGKTHAHLERVLKVAQRLHEQNDSVIKGRLLNKPPQVPDAAVRQQLAKQDTDLLRAVSDAQAKLASEAFDYRIKL